MSYIADDIFIANTQGILWVSKTNQQYDVRVYYYLEVQYKGCNYKVKYDTLKKRDEMFTRISDALTKKAK